jgi:CubicO group peptidase (beta-lactamase class C family)
MDRRFVARQGLIVIVATTIIAGSVRAQAQTTLSDTPEAFGMALRTWARQHDVERAFVVVRKQGRIVYRSAVGGADPERPVHLASLSKAITGACVATLIRDGKLTFDAPVATALSRFMARTSGDGDPRFRRVTVAQLLTHRAGFGTKNEDPASGPGLADYLRSNPASARPNPAFLSWALTHRLAHEPGSKFVYSNTGYLALGAVIEEVSGKGYAPYCREAVLAPLGLTGELEPSWRVMWSTADGACRPSTTSASSTCSTHGISDWERYPRPGCSIPSARRLRSGARLGTDSEPSCERPTRV